MLCLFLRSPHRRATSSASSSLNSPSSPVQEIRWRCRWSSSRWSRNCHSVMEGSMAVGGGVPDRHVLQNFTLTKRDKQLLYICCVKNKNKKKNNFSYMCIMCRNKYSLKWQKLSFKDCRLNPHQESDRQTDRLINKPTKQIKAAINNYYCVHTC